ncbi:MAG: hypothetical protein AB7I41_24990, partial [Candidatus Sericytochromatia bacterium]
DALFNLGCFVVRFGAKETWLATLEEHSYAFGHPQKISTATSEQKENQGIDWELFDEVWLPLFQALHALGIALECGNDLMLDGRVVARAEAQIEFQGKAYLVLDQRDGDNVERIHLLKSSGQPVLLLYPEQDPEALLAQLKAQE